VPNLELELGMRLGLGLFLGAGVGVAWAPEQGLWRGWCWGRAGGLGGSWGRFLGHSGKGPMAGYLARWRMGLENFAKVCANIESIPI